MKKILHIMLSGVVTEGWSYQDNLLPKYQVKLGHDVSIITSQWVYDNDGKLTKASEINYINSNGVKVFRLPLVGKDDINNKFRRYKNVYETIESITPDIVFVHNINALDIDQVCRYLRDNGVEAVYVDNHMDLSNSASNWLSKNILHKIIWKRNAKMIEPFTKKFYGVLPARVDFLVDMYDLPRDKCELLVMGVDDDEVTRTELLGVRDKIRNKYIEATEDIILLAGGKIDRNKPEIINLMHAIGKCAIHGIKLLVFGSIDDSLKERFNEANQYKNVIYIGWLTTEDIYDYLAAADMILFPGLHSVLWEQAVGSGKACVFRYINGFTHIDLKGNCEFFNDLSEEGMLKTLVPLLNHEVIDRMSSVAEKKGKNYFSYAEIAKRSINY